MKRQFIIFSKISCSLLYKADWENAVSEIVYTQGAENAFRINQTETAEQWIGFPDTTSWVPGDKIRGLRCLKSLRVAISGLNRQSMKWPTRIKFKWMYSIEKSMCPLFWDKRVVLFNFLGTVHACVNRKIFVLV